MVSGGKAAHTAAAPPARRPCRLGLDGVVQPKHGQLKDSHACNMWQGWKRSGWNTVNAWQGAPGPKTRMRHLSAGSAASSMVGRRGRGCCPHTSLQCKCPVGFTRSLHSPPTNGQPDEVVRAVQQPLQAHMTVCGTPGGGSSGSERPDPQWHKPTAASPGGGSAHRSKFQNCRKEAEKELTCHQTVLCPRAHEGQQRGREQPPPHNAPCRIPVQQAQHAPTDEGEGQGQRAKGDAEGEEVNQRASPSSGPDGSQHQPVWLLRQGQPERCGSCRPGKAERTPSGGSCWLGKGASRRGHRLTKRRSGHSGRARSD